MPDEGRGFVFVLMVVMATLQMIAKVFSTALLALTEAAWLAIWITSDVLIFLCYKQIRRDLVVYVPMKGSIKYIVSIIVRTGIKVIGDFTGLILLRTAYGKLMRFILKEKQRFKSQPSSQHLTSF